MQVPGMRPPKRTHSSAAACTGAADMYACIRVYMHTHVYAYTDTMSVEGVCVHANTRAFIYQGFHSNHAQTARFNIPTLLHRCNNHEFVVHVWALQ